MNTVKPRTKKEYGMKQSDTYVVREGSAEYGTSLSISG